MSKIFLHVSRNDNHLKRNFYEGLLERLNPSNTKNLLDFKNNFVLGVTNYNESVFYKNRLLALGKFKKIKDEYHFLGSNIPDGVSAILRFDSEFNIEVLTNKIASRTIWYYFDSKQLIVSTSQRMIINILGDYDHSEHSTSWFLSSGNLGPGNSWDSRIKHLNYDSSIYLNKSKWELKLKKGERLKIKNQIKDNSANMLEIIKGSFLETDLKNTKNVLTLSGGYDSRLVLELLKENKVDFSTLTWGTLDSFNNKDTDTYIAKKVAEKNQLIFDFYNVEDNITDFDAFLEKFVQAGEARIDHLSNFVDNFRMWEDFVSKGKEVIIRSDEVFGWLHVADEKNIRLIMEMTDLGDYSNFQNIEFYGMKKTTIPKEYLKSESESLYSYRDRLFNIYRQTFVQTSLHDLMYSYSEMVNPLFSNEIIDFCRNLNDKERTNKSLYIKSIKNLINYLPIASRSSYPSRENVLKSNTAYNYFIEKLNSKKAERFFSKELLEKILSGLRKDDEKKRNLDSKIKIFISENTPYFLKNLIRKRFRKFEMDYNLMAFRVVVVMKWIELIDQDLSYINEDKK